MGERSTARGYVFRRQYVWTYDVLDSEGKTVLTDNMRSWGKAIDSCREGVSAVLTVENAGHRLSYSFDELCDRAMEGL